MFPMPATLRWSSSASPIAARLVVVAQAARGSGARRSRRPSDVRAERRQARSKRVRESVISSSTGPSNSTTSCSAVRITSQARRGERAPALAAPVDAPLPAHAQVRVQRQVALEADEQVLAARVDRAHGPPGRAARASGPSRVARLRRLDREICLPTSARADAPRARIVDRVALGHVHQCRRGSSRAGAASVSAERERRACEAQLDQQLAGPEPTTARRRSARCRAAARGRGARGRPAPRAPAAASPRPGSRSGSRPLPPRST